MSAKLKNKEKKIMAENKPSTPDVNTAKVGNPSTKTNFVFAKLTDIFCDVDKFNGRSKSFLDESDYSQIALDTDQGKFAQVKTSIQSEGQDTPIIVRRNPDQAKNKAPLMVVVGHKRYMAILQLNGAGAVIPGLPEGMIKVEDKGEMSDADAYLMNARENLVRDDMTPGDKAFTIARLCKVTGKNQTEIALSLGVKQGYVSRLHKIGSKLNRKLLDLYRSGSVDLSLDQVEKVAAEEGEEAQAKLWGELIATKKGDKRDPVEKRKALIEAAHNRAKEIGRVFGIAARLESIDADEETLDWPKLLPEMMAYPSESTDDEKRGISRAAWEGFAAAFKPPQAPEEGTGPAPDTAKEGKAAKKKGGAAATPN